MWLCLLSGSASMLLRLSCDVLLSLGLAGLFFALHSPELQMAEKRKSACCFTNIHRDNTADERNECLMYLTAWYMSSPPDFAVVFVSSSRAVLYSLQLNSGNDNNVFYLNCWEVWFICRNKFFQTLVHKTDLLNLNCKTWYFVEMTVPLIEQQN